MINIFNNIIYIYHILKIIKYLNRITHNIFYFIETWCHEDAFQRNQLSFTFTMRSRCYFVLNREGPAWSCGRAAFGPAEIWVAWRRLASWQCAGWATCGLAGGSGRAAAKDDNFTHGCTRVGVIFYLRVRTALAPRIGGCGRGFHFHPWVIRGYPKFQILIVSTQSN
jgi:hypothetical protein